MRYFNEHRRKLIKQNYIRGTKATAQGVQKLELESTANLPPCKLEIHGKTEQKEYSGHNLFDANSAILSGCTLNDDGSISLNTSGACVDIPLMAGKYIISLERDFTSGTTWLRNGKVINGYIVRLDTEGETSLAKSFVFDASYDGYLRLQIYATGTISNIQIALGEEVKPYEPYVGGGVSPNPNYPQPIEAVSDFKLSAIGSNLFDIDKVKGCDKWTSTDPDGVGLYSYGSKLSDGSLQPKMGVYGAGSIWTGAKIPIKQGGDYFLSCEVKIDSTIILTKTDMTFGLRNHTKSCGYRTNGTYVSERDEWVKINLGGLTVPDDWVGDDVYLSTQTMGNSTQFTNLPVYFRNIMITYGEHTAYEPYKEPVTIPVNNVELAGIDGYQDILKLDFANKSAKKIERILYANVGDLIEDYGCEFDGNACFIIPNVPPRMNDEHANPYTYYCTHFTSYHNDSTIDANNPRFELGSSALYFYFTGHNTVSDFRQWCLDNDVKIAYVPLYEQQIDITGSEIGQCLLNLKLPESETVIFEVNSSVPPTSLSLEYYSKTKEDIYILTVRYEDREGNVLLESKTSSVRSGSRYMVIAPEIEGYEPLQKQVEGYLTSDLEITIIYKEK